MSYLLTILLSLILQGSYNTHVAYSTDSLHTKSLHHKMPISEVLDNYTEKWLQIPGVVGTGEGQSGGKPCILVFTNGNSKVIKKKIPKTVEGYKVVFQETGKIKARN
ncbi:MAG: hypothetical protein ACHQM6_10325 [Candidatus Kapaibacterium sp.]